MIGRDTKTSRMPVDRDSAVLTPVVDLRYSKVRRHEKRLVSVGG